MKISHVVTYLSRDGAYGGPLSVAMAHARMLAGAGHEVELVGGSDGMQLEVEGYRTYFPRAVRIGNSFFGVLSPAVLWRIARGARSRVFHLHLGRDMVGLPGGAILRLLGARYVVQSHGMIRPDHRPAARILDSLVTRPVLKGAHRWLVLDANDEAALSAVVQPRAGQVVRVFNTLDNESIGARPRDHETPMVVFASRLHPRKNVLVFAEAARLLIAQGVRARFEVWGPDEGDLGALLEIVESTGSDRLQYRGSFGPGHAREVLGRADVFVLPSEGEVFPMSVLEAMSAGAAVVAPSDCEMANTLRASGAAQTTRAVATEVAATIAHLLNDDGERAAMVARAFVMLETTWSAQALVSRLENCYA